MYFESNEAENTQVLYGHTKHAMGRVSAGCDKEYDGVCAPVGKPFVRSAVCSLILQKRNNEKSFHFFFPFQTRLKRGTGIVPSSILSNCKGS